MRFEIVNTITGESRNEQVPAGTNPVLFGNGPAAHVRLPSGFIGAVAGAIGNTGDGWRIWNHHGRDIRVENIVLAQRNQSAPLGDGMLFTCNPFEVRVFFDPSELATVQDDWRVRDRLATELVRNIHTELSRHYGREIIDRATEYADSFIQKLEEDIGEVASRSEGFPPDELTSTALGNHLAGLATRSELLVRLVSRSGGKTDNVERKLRDGWARLRTKQQKMEEIFEYMVKRMEIELDIVHQGDLTEQMKKVETGFWPAWEALLTGTKDKLDISLRRYLALRRVKKEIKDIWYGFGPLEELLDDPTVAEIMVVDKDNIFIEKGGHIEITGRRFIDDAITMSIIKKIVNLADRSVDTSEPMVDARMPDGSRVNAIIPPLALRGPCLTIRRFPSKRLSIDDLIAVGSLSVGAKNFLQAAVESRRNVIVAGGTGTGKTTLLNCLSSFIPDKERIVTIEDTAELQLQKQHVVILQARQKNLEGKGEKSIRDLVKNSLRMRPDRIVVGECRGGEALDMLQAMNTGHDGSMTTIHANSPADVIGRLEVLCQQNPDVKLPIEAIHRQAASAIDLIVQLSVINDRGRKRKVVAEIVEVQGMHEGKVRLVSLFAREGNSTELRPTGHLASFTPELLAQNKIAHPLELLQGMSEKNADAPTTRVASTKA